MKSGNQAKLTMKKILRKGMDFDPKAYSCKILRYDLKEECIYLVLENSFLKEISLDAIYECVIDDTSEQKISCTGRVKERYNGEAGAILELEIENGFYKINVKSVDK